MSLVTFKGDGLLIPSGFGAVRRDLHGTSSTIDAAGEKYGMVFKVPRTGTIDRLGFTTRTVTTPQTLRVGLETTDGTNYYPTGTQYGGSAVGTQTSPATDTFYEVTLATPATAVKGDVVALVVQFDSTVGAVNIGQIDDESGGNYTAFPYNCLYTTSWAKSTASIPMCSVRYNDGSYESIGACVPTRPRVDTFFNVDSATDEYGNRFTVPADCRAISVYTGCQITAAVDIVLYEGSTALRTISVPADLSAHATGYATFYFDTPVYLTAGTVYRLVLKPTTTTNVAVREAVMLNSAMMNMIPGGTDWYKTARTDGGAWTDTDTRRIWSLSLMIDQFHTAPVPSLITLPGHGFYWPPYFNRQSTGFGLGDNIGIIDAAGERLGIVFQVPKTGTIDRVLWRTGGVTTPQSLDVALETVSAANGAPTGTDYGSSTPGTVASPVANTLYEVTLGSAATATVGDVVSVVIDFTSTVGNVGIGSAGGTRDANQGFPYAKLYTTSWATQSDLNLMPVVGVRYNDGTYENVGSVIGSAVTSGNYNNTSTPDERGNKYTISHPMRCSGFWALVSIAASATFDAILYDSNNTVIASVSVDPDQISGTDAPKLINMRWAPVILNAGYEYRFIIKPTSANDVGYVTYTVSNNAQLDCNPAGRNVTETYRTDAGAWTDTATVQSVAMGLVFDQIDNGEGGGGSGMITHPSMSGGIRG